MLSVSDLLKKYKISSEYNILPDAVSINDTSLEDEIGRMPSFQEALNTFKNLAPKFVLQYYFLNKTEYRNEDLDLAKIFNDTSDAIDVYIYNLKLEIKRKKEEIRLKYDEYELFNNRINNLKKITSNITHRTEKRFYSMFDLNDNEINLGNLIDVFQNINPNDKIRLIVLSNSQKKLTFKVNPNYMIRYIESVKKVEFEPNTISLFYGVSKYDNKICRRTVLNFNNSNCIIEVYGDKSDDNTDFYVRNLISGFIKLEKKTNIHEYLEDDEDENITGEVEYNISQISISHDLMYKFFTLNSDAKRFFNVDERRKPWCSNKEGFKVIYFHPLSLILHEFYSNSIHPSGVITISSVESKIENNYKVTFKTKSLDLMNLMIFHFSKMLVLYTQHFDININSNLNYITAFHTTVFTELKERAADVFISADKISGKTFSVSVDPDKRPICISEDEIESYKSMGRNVESITVGESDYNFVCIHEDNPVLKIVEAGVEIKSGNKFFPKCFSIDYKERNVADINTESSGIATTALVKSFKKRSFFENGNIRDFFENHFGRLNQSDYKDTQCLLMGVLPNLKRNKSKSEIDTDIANSAIYALLLANGTQFVSPAQMLDECRNVRRLMIELPYSIFGQELYNYDRNNFIENMNNIEHYIDPYLYYRGLEEIFNVSIFVFISERGRDHPFSYDESKMELPTLEIPNCKNYHTRTYNERDVICLFKNYNSEKTIFNSPSCELIIIHRKSGDDNIIKYNQYTGVFKAIWGHFQNITKTIYFENTKREIQSYLEIFTGWDPNLLGFGTVKGQELDSCGKTKLLIYDEWNVIVPGIQPLVIYNQAQRAPLKTKDECRKLLVITREDNDGLWMEFQGNEKGIKVLCLDDDINTNVVEYKKINDIITNKNYISALLQIINWLWRSYENPMPFEIYLSTISIIYNREIFYRVGIPKKCLNNLFLQNFDTQNERMRYLASIWPFFFRNGKFFLYKELYDRILNFMMVQEQYTNNMKFDDFHREIPKFITGLIYTDDDFKRDGNIIFNSMKYFEDWIEMTNPDVFNYSSLNNVNIIYDKIYPVLVNYKNPYLYRDTFTDKIYLVQNVKKRSNKPQLIALKIALEWRNTMRNLGYNTTSDDITFKSDDLQYVEMAIDDKDQKLKPAINKSQGTDSYITIFFYGAGEYAALLPLI
jgi:hypothetical protein